jgi:hypothetical protein
MKHQAQLTPARIRKLHAKLDKLIQANDGRLLNAVVSLMDAFCQHVASAAPRTRPRAERES